LIHLQSVAALVPKHSMESLAYVEAALSAVGEAAALPSLESYKDTTLATEGLGDRIRQLIANIRAFLARIVVKIKAFFGALGEDASQLQFRLELARDLHKELSGRFPKKSQVQLGQTALMLAMREGIPNDARLIMTYGRNIETQLKSLRTNYIPSVKTVGSGLADLLKHPAIGADQGDGWLDKMTQVCAPMSFDRLKQVIGPLSRMVDSRFTVNSAYMGPPILGGRALVLLDGRVDHSGSDPISRAMAARHTKFVFVRPYQAKQVDTSMAVMPTIPHTLIGGVLDLAQDLLTEVGHSQGEGLRSSLVEMDRQLDALAKQVPDAVGNVNAIQVGLGFGTSFSQWCTAPYLEMISHTLSVVNALIIASNKHMAAYR